MTKIDTQQVESLREQIASCERDIAEIDRLAGIRKMDRPTLAHRTGIEACLEQLKKDLRFELGEADPTHH